MKTLDKQKPYGTVYGDQLGRCYEQDGVVFDAEGNEWKAPPPPPEPSEPTKKAK